MLIADGDDLNPTMLLRWQTLPGPDPQGARPGLRPLARPRRAAGRATSRPGRGRSVPARESPPTRPGRSTRVVARALAEQPPRSLAEAATDLRQAAQRGRGRLAGGEPPRGAERHRARASARPGPGGAPPGLPRPGRPARRAAGPVRRPGAAARPPVAGEAPGAAQAPSRTGWPTAPARRRGRWRWKTRPTPVEPRVFLRGNPEQPGRAGPAQFLGAPGRARSRSRSATAAAGSSWPGRSSHRDNPLTARVLVNRVWMHHFGTPLVATPGDFGLRSDPPTHPELLDHLAAPFMDEGWSLKALHRRIMLSSTYQQASDDRPEARAVDPENALFWRMNRRRLDFEAMRDALLGGLRPARPHDRRPARRRPDRPRRPPPDALRPHRPPEPAGPLPHLRLPRPQRHQPAAATRRPCRPRPCS